MTHEEYVDGSKMIVEFLGFEIVDGHLPSCKMWSGDVSQYKFPLSTINGMNTIKIGNNLWALPSTSKRKEYTFLRNISRHERKPRFKRLLWFIKMINDGHVEA